MASFWTVIFSSLEGGEDLVFWTEYFKTEREADSRIFEYCQTKLDEWKEDDYSSSNSSSDSSSSLNSLTDYEKDEIITEFYEYQYREYEDAVISQSTKGIPNDTIKYPHDFRKEFVTINFDFDNRFANIEQKDRYFNK